MNVAEAMKLIPAGGWLGAMPRAARLAVVELSTPSHIEAGTELVREGARATTMGIVVAGRVALQLNLPGRGRVTVATVESGDVFGVSAIVPPHVATMSVTAIGPADVLFVDVAALRKRFAADCELTAAVYFAVSRALLARLTATHEVLVDLLATSQAPG